MSKTCASEEERKEEKGPIGYSTQVADCSGQVTVGENSHIISNNYYSSLTVYNVSSAETVAKRRPLSTKKKQKKSRNKRRKKNSGVECHGDVASDFIGAKGNSALAGSNVKEQQYSVEHGVETKAELCRQSNGTRSTNKPEQSAISETNQGCQLEESRLGRQFENLGPLRQTSGIKQRQQHQHDQTVVEEKESSWSSSRQQQKLEDCTAQNKGILEASTYKKAIIRQSIGFLLCITLSVFYDITCYIPYCLYLVFLVNNLFTCSAFIDIKLIASRKSRPVHHTETEVNGPFCFFCAAACIEVQCFAREEEFVRTLLAVLVSVSLGFFSSLLFGCLSCIFEQTMVILVSGSIPYATGLKYTTTFAIAEQCRVFRKEFKRKREKRKKRRHHIKEV